MGKVSCESLDLFLADKDFHSAMQTIAYGLAHGLDIDLEDLPHVLSDRVRWCQVRRMYSCPERPGVVLWCQGESRDGIMYNFDVHSAYSTEQTARHKAEREVPMKPSGLKSAVAMHEEYTFATPGERIYTVGSRLDFDPENYSPEELKALIAEADAIMRGDRKPFSGVDRTSPEQSLIKQQSAHAAKRETDLRATKTAKEEMARRAKEPTPTPYWDPEDVDLL